MEMFTRAQLEEVFISHVEACRRLGNPNANSANLALSRLGIKPIRIAGRYVWLAADIDALIGTEKWEKAIRPYGVAKEQAK